MAIKKVRIRPKGENNYGDILHPETTADLVKFSDGSTVEAHRDNGTQHAKTARFVIGTSATGWTSADCDYLCDGVDDQTEINDAITALPASGGEIVILDGTYNITSKINVTRNNISIRGNGNATILKRMFDSSTPEGVIMLIGRSGCKIANLQIDGNNTVYVSTVNSGIYLDDSSDNAVTSNTCNSSYSSGIQLNSSSNNAVTSNTCNSNQYGIRLDSSSNNTITGNTYNSNKYGICLYSSSNNAVTSNTCNSSYSSGIQLNSSSNNAVTSNTCNNNYHDSGSGISLKSSSNDNTITGNTCNNNYYGIQLNSSSNNIVTSNTCNSNGNSGISLKSSSNDNAVTSNTCNNNYYGIYLDVSSNNIVTSNTCIRGTGLATDYSTSQHTIWLAGTNNSYNLISNNNCMGKAVTNDGGTGNTLVNNKFDAT